MTAGSAESTAPLADERISACVELIRLYSVMAECDGFPEQQAEEMRAGIEMMRAGWKDSSKIDDATADRFDEACAQSIPTVHEQLASIGCDS